MKTEVKIPDITDNTQRPNGEPEEEDWLVHCDFEERVINFTGLQFAVVDNPNPSGINTSANSGRITSAGGQWEFIWCNPLAPAFNFREITDKTQSITEKNLCVPLCNSV